MSAILDVLRAHGICTKADTSSISGGCISDAFKLATDSGDIFVKTHNARNAVVMFEGEKESLQAISEAVPNFAPKPLCVGILPKGGAFLATTFLQLSKSSTPDMQVLFAKKLAKLHSTESPNGMFGFPVVTMCGSTEQDNEWEKDWETFFRERRLRPMLSKCLQDNPGDVELRKLGEVVIDKVIHHLLKDIEVRPVLIHGDLWSGNWGVDLNDGPVVFDPSCCYGHNEMEFSILTMFGSPGHAFFREYYSHHPRLEPGYEHRQGF
ncbi:6865_t:CDS:2 [Acaulospora morrowiae]|uniref:protein-ribulosamine 3-kinase n=1 Tax=Acaulospora morrowiae TaxID=94023 RepID=A0A9N9G3S0_9GLOM|nr:6865_t:CDS:2 [Acaulospora morrowiae]